MIWEKFREWIGHWFIHNNAANSGVTMTSIPAPAAPAPAAPAPAAPAPAAPAPAAPLPTTRLPAAQPVSAAQATLSTAESVVKLLGTAVGALKNSKLLSGSNGSSGRRPLEPDSDSEDSATTAASDTEPPDNFVNDSSDVVD